MTLKASSRMKLTKNRERQLGILIIGLLGFVGFLDSVYLTILHYQHAIPPCSISNGCETVLTSSYSEIYGIPISLLGAGFYASVIGLSLSLLTLNLNAKWKMLNGKLLFLDAVAGFVVSAILIYIQFGILKAYCQYCVISEIVSFGIFVVAVFLWKNLQLKKKN